MKGKGGLVLQQRDHSSLVKAHSILLLWEWGGVSVGENAQHREM